MIDVKNAMALQASRTDRLRCGLLARWGSCWIGVHYSAFDRRYCINVLPCVTLWITLPGGYVPR